jgi:2-oxoglutarate dehydrogenase E1 component
VVSTLDECANGTFQRILPDALARPTDQVRRVLLCAGKIYYELDAYRAESKRDDVAIVRLEQLYPLRIPSLQGILQSYPDGTPVFWVQEEPANMGAWEPLRIQFGEKLFGRFPLSGICRPVSATPATGSNRRHKQEQADIINRAFA